MAVPPSGGPTRITGLDAGRGRVPGLDGLRAIAIIAVLIFHLHASWLPGGFLGVDVFFVVSGFLITTLLLRELERSGRVQIKDFYVRRARRLLPALVLTLLGSVSAALIVDRNLLLDIGRQTLGALTFSTNWLEVFAGSDYFASTQPLLLMNFWSLAVEEQFYLFWPVALILLIATTRRLEQRLAVVLGIGVVSLLLMAVLLNPEAATRVYYGTDTHLFGLMIGAALALMWCSPGRSLLGLPVWRQAALPALIGSLLVLGLLLVTLTETNAFTFRGGLLLGSLATAVLIAALLDGPRWWRQAMEWPPLVWIGERSYGIYLWHWPVVLITDAAIPTTPVTASFVQVRLLALALTIGIAAASYRFVEMPIRRDGFRETIRRCREALLVSEPVVTPARVLGASAMVLVLTSGVALAVAPTQTAAERMAEENAALLSTGGGRPGTDGSKSTKPKPKPTTSKGAGKTTDADSPSTGTTPTPGASSGEPTTTPSASTTPPASEAPEPSSTTSDGQTPDQGDEGMFNGIRDREGANYPDGVPLPTQTDHIAANPAFTMPKGDELTIFGDSMVVTTAGALDWYFPGVVMDAKSNRRWGDAVQVVRDHQGIRRAVVIDFGTNGSVVEDDLREVLKILGPDRMVVLMTIYGKSDWIDSSNETLRRVASEHPNVIVTEWNEVAKQHPDVLQADKVHPTTPGAHMFAKTVASGLAALSEKATGQKVEWVEPIIP